jgi:hypothetical protein
MVIPKRSGARAERPRGNAGRERTGQGAASALQEMLRRRQQDPRPGGLQAVPRREPARTESRRVADGKRHG